MESKNNNNIIVTILLVIIIIGLLGFILYDKVLKKDINTNNTTSNVEENNNKEEIQKEISIVDAVNYKAVSEDEFIINVNLPKIVGNTQMIEKLNKEILEDNLSNTYLFEDCKRKFSDETRAEELCPKNNVKVEYDYLIKNDIVLIWIYAVNPDGSTVNPEYGLSAIPYIYDSIQDKILTVKEAAKKFELDITTFEDNNIDDNALTITKTKNGELNVDIITG